VNSREGERIRGTEERIEFEQIIRAGENSRREFEQIIRGENSRREFEQAI
jgi:hypothetical protein